MRTPTATADQKALQQSRRSPSPLLDIGEVAVRLGVTVRHVRRLVHERRIPFIKWGHLLRFEAAELEEWIESARVTIEPRARLRR